MGVFHVFKLYKWYQTAQSITYDASYNAPKMQNEN